jgi:hypothetical protein
MVSLWEILISESVSYKVVEIHFGDAFKAEEGWPEAKDMFVTRKMRATASRDQRIKALFD